MFKIVVSILVIIPCLVLFFLMITPSLILNILVGGKLTLDNLRWEVIVLTVVLLGIPTLALVLLIINLLRKNKFSQINPFLVLGLVGGIIGLGLFVYVFYLLGIF